MLAGVRLLSSRVCTRNLHQIVCTRNLHQIVQRDTTKTVPVNEVFIRTPDTAPVLTCNDYSEIEQLLTESPAERVLTATFVVRAVQDGGKKMRKERGVATLATRVRDTTVLAVCDADVHGDAYDSGATKCVEPAVAQNELEISANKYDVVVCTSRVLPALKPLGRILKTKMPHERRGTVAPTIQSAVRRALLNMEWEMVQSTNHSDYYNVTLPLIKTSFPVNTLRDHVQIMFNEIINFCPAKTPPNEFIERLELNDGDNTIHVDIREHNDKLKKVEVGVLKKKYSREETWELRETAKKRSEFLERETEKIGEFLEQHWDRVKS